MTRSDGGRLGGRNLKMKRGILEKKSALEKRVEETARNLGSDCPPMVARKQSGMTPLSDAEKLEIWQQADDEWRKGMQELKRIFTNATAHRGD